VKRGKKKKRVKEKKNVELLKLLPKHILTKQTNFLHSPEFCCNFLYTLRENENTKSTLLSGFNCNLYEEFITLRKRIKWKEMN
jgi:hypothetical protein